MSESVLTASRISRVYGARGPKGAKNGKPLEVLKGIDLDLKAGELVAVVGPSGAGKSTLIHCLAGIDLPTAGEVRVGGRSLAALSERERSRLRHERMGLIFQFFHLLQDLSAIENVLVATRLYADRRVPDARRRAERLLDLFGMTPRAEHHPSELSGGEMQRVAIARALIMDPQVLLCDEPTGNLDTANGQAIIETLSGLARRDKKTVLIVTHDDRISRVADRVLHMRDGAWV